MKTNKLEQIEPTEDIQKKIRKILSSLSFLKNMEDRK